MVRLRYVLRIAGLALGSIIAVALALSVIPSAGAQTSDVQIVELDCSGDPERVVIENLGDGAQDFIGWELQSDPVGSEVFDLSTVGGLPAGASITIQSGPSASGAFNWSTAPIFRDDDPTDYARIIDDAGATVDQADCAVGATPTPSPTPSPAAGVPNGGGPPPLAEDDGLPVAMLLVGGSVAVAGVALIAVPRLRLRPARAAAVSRPAAESGGVEMVPGEPRVAVIGLALAVSLAALAFVLLRRR